MLAAPNVSGFPLDHYLIWPDARIAAEGLVDTKVNLHIVKQLPGHVLTTNHDPVNLELRLGRPLNERIAIVGYGLWFLMLTGAVALIIARTKTPSKGWEDAIALGGYVIAAAGLRQLIGLDRAASTSASELAFFMAPLILLSIAIMVRYKRTALCRSKSGGSDGPR